jgi:hypothetical protein
MTLTADQAEMIAALKSGRGRRSLPIRTDKDTLGHLVPVTAQLAGDERVVDVLCRWRGANRSCFLTVFTPSVERTSAYFLDYLLPDPARILFIVHAADSTMVGNIGLCNVARDGAEVDNVIRGEASPLSTIMVDAQRTLLDWSFRELDSAPTRRSGFAASSTCRSCANRRRTDTGWCRGTTPAPRTRSPS